MKFTLSELLIFIIITIFIWIEMYVVVHFVIKFW